MKIFARFLKVSILCGMFLPMAFGAVAQDYEDDLYYSPSRARAQEQARAQAEAAAREAAGLGAADHYTQGSSMPLKMDVDTYNRRNVAATASQQFDGGNAGNFNYTHRIERFHNPDVVSASNDTALIDYYYSTPTTQDINVYVINNVDPVGSFWNWPSYNYWNWGWNYPYWRFGWNSWTGWDFGFNWGYRPWWGPAWGPGWNWGPSWAWGPSWGPGWYPGPVYPSRPGYDRPGASRPHGPSYGTANNTGYRPGNNFRPGSTNSGDSFRPGGTPNSNRPGNFGNPTMNYNPGNGGYSVPAGGNSGSYTPTNNDLRGRNNGNRTTPSNNSGTRYTPSYNNNSGSSFGGSSRGRSGGSTSRGGAGGSSGGSSGGGGSHRGR